jgi:hypothetical protein
MTERGYPAEHDDQVLARCAGDPAALARFVTSITRILAATIH